MADKREDQLTSASDMAYVRALDSSGNSIRIAKADLIGLMERSMQSVKSAVWVACRDSNNSLICTPWENWYLGRTGAEGVVVMEGSHRIMVALDEANLYWSSKTGSGGATTATSKDTADQDFDGKGNTSDICSSTFSSDGSGYAPGYCHAYSKGNTAAGSWWLPSLGELGIIWAHFEEINAALERITGATQLSRVYYGSSTEASATNAWGLYMYTGGRWGSSKTTFQLRVRPVSAF